MTKLSDDQQNDVARLVGEAQQQLDEHKRWLKDQMYNWMHTQADGEWKLQFRTLISKVDDIKLRLSRVEGENATVVYEFPDELIAFLKAETTPEHLRAVLTGGHILNPDQPGHSAQRLS